MDPDREYELTRRVTRSMTRNAAFQQALQHNRDPTGLPLQEKDIPSRQDLDQMRRDLESILGDPEERKERLERDLARLEKGPLLRSQQTRRSSSAEPSRGGKDIKVIERIRKHDRDEYEGPASSRSHVSRISKSQLERQAALETLKRRRRREDSDRNGTNGLYSSTPDYLERHNGAANAAMQEDDEIEEGTYLNSLDTLQRKRKADEDSQPISNQKKRATNNGHNPNRDEELDFVRVKPQNQVPIYTYWSAMEPYFRALTEDDREFLLQKDDDATPFEIPPLGQHYKEKWEQEEALLLGDDDASYSRAVAGSSSKRSFSLITGEEDENEDREARKRYRNDDNSVLQRWLSCLMPEPSKADEEARDIKPETDDGESNSETENLTDQETDDESIIEEVEIASHVPDDEGFEERLKEELCYAKVLQEEQLEGDWPAQEDDEISAELRRLQQELKEQVQVNEDRKRKLLKVVDQQLQYEEYQQVLDTFDQQVEQSYVKRFRAQKVKKRKSGSAPKPPLSEHAVAAMEKRSLWLKEMGPIFNEKNMVMPKTSIYDD